MRIAQWSASSNVGRKRRHNEDSYVEAPPVFAVADGMGGAQAGEIASSLAAETVRELDNRPGVNGEERVVALIKAANLRVHDRAAADAAASGMGTTLTVALVQEDGGVAIGHVGDSRAYRLRDGQLEQLTDDHSLVAELVRRGELSPAEAAVHPQRSVITRALGTESDVDVDVFTVEAKDGDLFLLCSDGLTTMVDVDTIAAILERHRSSLAAATSALIKAANDRGGDDNITAILFAVAEGDPPPGEELAPPGGEHDSEIEDTLYPEDNVRLPDDLAPPAAEVTMVISAEEIARAQAHSTQEAALPPPEAPPAVSQEGAPSHSGGEAPTEQTATEQPGASTRPAWELELPGADDAPEFDPASEPAEKVSLVRLSIAFLVIAALVAAIVLLVLEALPR